MNECDGGGDSSGGKEAWRRGWTHGSFFNPPGKKRQQIHVKIAPLIRFRGDGARRLKKVIILVRYTFFAREARYGMKAIALLLYTAPAYTPMIVPLVLLLRDSGSLSLTAPFDPPPRPHPWPPTTRAPTPPATSPRWLFCNIYVPI